VYEVAGREYIAISARPNTDRIGIGDQMQSAEANPGGPAQIGPPPNDNTQGYYVFALPIAPGKQK
jgi:hypothetical protein